MSEENMEVVQRAYEIFNRWGVHPEEQTNPEMPPLLHPEIEFHTHPTAPEAGVYRGRDAVIEYHENVFRQFESVRIEVEEAFPAGDCVVLLTRQHTIPRGSGAEITQNVVDLWMIRDGLLAKRVPFASRAEAVEAAGLSE
jgi:ketosteroid isomerase-like protein